MGKTGGQTGRLLRVICLIVPVAIPAHADDAVLRQIMQGLAAQPSREAGFVSEKHLSSLAAPVRSQGRLIFRKPNYLEQDTTTPRPERLVIDGDSVTMTSPDAPARQLGLDDSPALRILADTLRGALAGDLSALRRHFLVEEGGPLSQWRITLRPSGNVTAQVIQRVYIDGNGSRVGQLDIVQANGDEQRLSLSP
jgi:outer membrane lipoprotein-sorting protein